MKKRVYLLLFLICFFFIATGVNNLSAARACYRNGDADMPSRCLEGEELSRFPINGVCVGGHLCSVTIQFICFDYDHGGYYFPRGYAEVFDSNCPSDW